MKPDLSQFIKNKAYQLGFDKIGFSSVTKLVAEGQNLNKWLKRGYHADMDWMNHNTAKRTDILNYFSDAKSVVSVAMNYFHGIAEQELKVSNYSWGDDYHNVIKVKLQQLLHSIQEYDSSISGLLCVDSSPVMEKVWAQRAGLGWHGKHTNLISQDFGSWLFLGELILDCELNYNNPFSQDFCGSCTKCMDACPTGALVKEYVLDSNKCISYLTIENKSDIPDTLSDKLNGWIFGCDICQEVCPWNRKFAKLSNEYSFKPRSEITAKSKEDWYKLTEQEFQRIFRNSSIKRTKFKGMIRNIFAN